MLRERFQGQDRNGGVNCTDRATNEIRGSGRVATCIRCEFEMKENIALKTTGKRKVECATWFLGKQIVPCVRNDADDFDLCFSLATVPPARIAFVELNPLAQRVAIGPKLLRQDFIDYCGRG